MTAVKHLTIEELEAGLDDIRRSPRDDGVLQMIVRRPGVGVREVVEEAELSVREGLAGDNWATRGCTLTEDGSAHPEMQINIMNARSIALVAQDRSRWQLAGDQLFVDLDLSAENLPPGSRLSIGTAILEITPIPHNGCKKFVERFGKDAVIFVNSDVGKQLHLRGVKTPGSSAPASSGSEMSCERSELMHYLLFYEKMPDYAERQAPLAEAHRAHLAVAVRDGMLLLGGSLSDPEDGSAMLVFRTDARAIVEAFASSDPYVVGGVVCRWWVRAWLTVVGTAL